MVIRNLKINIPFSLQSLKQARFKAEEYIVFLETISLLK